MIMMYQNRFTDCNKYITLVQDVDTYGGRGYMGILFSTQFFGEPKTVLKNKVIKKSALPYKVQEKIMKTEITFF